MLCAFHLHDVFAHVAFSHDGACGHRGSSTNIKIRRKPMANSTGLQFTVKVGALAAGTFAVVDFRLDEGLNRPFSLSAL